MMLTLKKLAKSPVGSPTTRMQLPIFLIQSGCLVSELGLTITIGNPPYVRADAGGELTSGASENRKRLNSMKHFGKSGIYIFPSLNGVINY